MEEGVPPGWTGACGAGLQRAALPLQVERPPVLGGPGSRSRVFALVPADSRLFLAHLFIKARKT